MQLWGSVLSTGSPALLALPSGRQGERSQNSAPGKWRPRPLELGFPESSPSFQTKNGLN